MTEQDLDFTGEPGSSQYVLQYLPFVALIIFWFLFKGKWGMFVYDYVTFLTMAIAFGIAFASETWAMFKHKTPKLVFDHGFTSSSGRYLTAGHFVIFRMGDIDSFLVSQPGTEGAIIVPRDSFVKVGPNTVCGVKCEEVDIDTLPHEVRLELAGHKINGPYLFGLANQDDHSLEVTDVDAVTGVPRPKVSYMINAIKQLNRENAHLRKLQDGKYDDIEKTVGFASRIHERAQGGPLQRFLGWASKKEERRE